MALSRLRRDAQQPSDLPSESEPKEAESLIRHRVREVVGYADQSEGATRIFAASPAMSSVSRAWPFTSREPAAVIG